MKRALSFFNSTIKKNRMSHLYLIEGPKGSGKLTLSFLVSTELLKRKGEDEQRLLNQIRKLNHPNVILIQPDGNSIKKEQILNLQNEFSKTSLYSGARVYIIEDIEKITQAGANSLLKFLEEPEGKTTYGFLLTENLSQVIQTIQSRSQIIHLIGIDKLEIKEQLIAKGANPLISEILPEITNSIEEAIELIELQPVLEIAEFIEKISNDWLNEEVIFSIDYSKLLNETKGNIDWYKSFSNLVLIFFTDLIRYKVHRTITFESRRSEIQRISAKLSLNDLERITSNIRESINRLRVPININMYYQKLLLDLDKERNL
ncbi:MAG: hypothetical protein ACOX5X_02820 [Acholeplasmataceae bacterium]|jgi:DNA polymerase-3 subunit delta'